MKQWLKTKGAGFYVGLVGAVAALLVDVAYMVLDYGDKTFSMAAFVLILLAVGIEGLVLGLRWTFLPLLPPILVGTGVGMHLYTAFPSITDLINKIVFIGGNSQLAVDFAIAFAATGLLFILAAFLPSNSPHP